MWESETRGLRRSRLYFIRATLYRGKVPAKLSNPYQVTRNSQHLNINADT